MRALSSVAAIVMALASGCGGATSSGGSDAGRSADSSSDATPAIDSGPAPGCPASFSSVNPSTTCTMPNLLCQYPQGACICIVIDTGPGMADASPPPPTWQCASPAPGCPASPPTVGSSCSMPGNLCDYGVCGQPPNDAFYCDGTSGKWTAGIAQNRCTGA